MIKNRYFKMNILVELNFKQKHGTRFLTCILGLLVFMLIQENILMCFVLGAFMILFFKNPTPLYIFWKTCVRDVVAAYRFVKLNLFIRYYELRNWSYARIFYDTVKKYPNKTCYAMDDRYFTFQCVENYSEKIGLYFKSKGFKHGDCIALFMETRPEYVCIWLGLSKIGVITALINSHQQQETLLHSIIVSNSKAIIVGSELADTLNGILHSSTIDLIPIYQFQDNFSTKSNKNWIKDAIDLVAGLKTQPSGDLSSDINGCSPKQKMLYVYTSGTTGLPKAAVITNLRALFMASGTFYMMNLKRTDTIYNPLPLYHTAGGVVGVGLSLIHGSTVILRKKFSSSNFWNDCIKYNCTAAQYIGEICRYLLSMPPKPEDSLHNLRLLYGNGLRPQIWSQFISRFNIPAIGEIYGSSEGNSNLANTTDQVGAVGFIPVFGRKYFPIQIIKCDEETGEPIRNKDGYCIRCKPGEVGMLIGKIDSTRPSTAFNGYADKEATEKKLFYNVFKKSDIFFNSGDMVVEDILGFIYFMDRTGDTFRWRGENVATMEVEAIITNIIGLKDCVAYGVEIPFCDGKAGMAAIAADPLDLDHICNGIRGSLPPYAQPIFLRFMKEIPRTSTYKFKKRELMLENFDIYKINDPIYYLSNGCYIPLTEGCYNKIVNGQTRL